MQLAPAVKYASGDYANSEVNKVLVDRFHSEIFTEGRLGVADEILSRDFTAHWAGAPQEWQKGPEGIRSAASGMRSAFPDVSFDHELVFARSGKVVVLWTMRGTHTGEFMGVAPSGKPVEVTGTDIYMVSPTGPEGKIVELWRNWDQWGMLQQIGAVPSE